MNEKQIVALSIDKVQTFLTETIHAHVQEKQTEAATLKNIMNSSREISNDFHDKVRKKFPKAETEELLSCSGVYIFNCNLPIKDIEDKLNQLFLEYYHSSQGQEMLRCIFFPTEKRKEIEAIQEAKKRLKQSHEWNARIEKNREVLFSFATAKESVERTVEKETNDPKFVNKMDDLFCKEDAENEKRFRIAVIKADLDGMGAMFKKIDKYEDYRTTSEVLNEIVSLDGLHKAAEQRSPSVRGGWLFPFYAAGDDIFFAVSVANLFNGVNVCIDMIRDIKKNLKEKLIKKGIETDLSISIGVEITFNRQPIRYYMDMVEQQLKNAKNAKKTEIPELLKNDSPNAKISICGLTYMDVDYKEIKGKLKCLKSAKNSRCKCDNCEKKREVNRYLQSLPIWGFFIHDICVLNYIKFYQKEHQELGTSGFFYKLLERVTDKTICDDDTKYINSVLYHLLPKYLDGADQELAKLELLLNAGIIRQLCRNENNENEANKKMKKKGKKIVLDKTSKFRLETYLRVLLLFSDNRFHIAGGFDPEEKKIFDGAAIEDAKKCLLRITARYLYEEELSEKNKDLSNVFIKRVSYVKKEKDKKDNPNCQCFQLLHIEKSMFFKLRNVKFKKAAAMIELKNPADAEQKINEKNKERYSEGKAPYSLYYNKKLFLELPERAWSSDFVDSLMLFYEYKKMGILCGKHKPK